MYDAQSHAVEFSIVTNAGNQAREKLAQMIQQDLKRIGIRLNVVKLDYSAIIDRISQSFDYESCLLGLTNVDLDPDAQMNVWLSSASNHQWNPNQASPATPWEAEIDRLMQAQGSELNPAKRKAYFDKVQEIVSQEVPFLYLVTRNALVAVSPSLQNANPSVLRPQAVWNIEMLALAPEVIEESERLSAAPHPAFHRLPGQAAGARRCHARRAPRRDCGAGGRERIGQEQPGAGPPPAARSEGRPRLGKHLVQRPGSHAIGRARDAEHPGEEKSPSCRKALLPT